MLDGQEAQLSHGATIGACERTITRLAVLKAAASFAASRPEAKSPDVLAVAQHWLAWVEGGHDG